MEVKIPLDNISFLSLVSNENCKLDILYKDPEGKIYVTTINDFKNITLDLKTVKQKPIELFHYYTTWETATNLIKLNNFVGSPINFDNPLIFDIGKYMGRTPIESNPIQPFESRNQKLSRIMKFSEHLFTYYIRFPYEIKIKNIHMNRARIDFVFWENMMKFLLVL